MTAIEFVFLTPVIFMVLMATVQFSIYLFAKQAALSAVRAGDRVARQEAANEGCMAANSLWQTNAESFAGKRANDLAGSLLIIGSGDVVASAAPDYSVAAGCQATVTVELKAKIPQILPFMNTSVDVTASGPVEQFVRHP